MSKKRVSWSKIKNLTTNPNQLEKCDRCFGKGLIQVEDRYVSGDHVCSKVVYIYCECKYGRDIKKEYPC